MRCRGRSPRVRARSCSSTPRRASRRRRSRTTTSRATRASRSSRSLNKIDLPAAEPERAPTSSAKLLDCDPEEILRVSAKSGAGVTELLKTVIERCHRRSGDADRAAASADLRLMFDTYRGVITYVRVKDGAAALAATIKMFATRVESEAEEAGVMAPEATPVDALGPGEVGYLVTGSRTCTRRRSATRSRSPGRRQPPSRCPGIASPSRWCGRGCSRPTGSDYATCARPSTSSSSRTPPCTTSPRRRRRSGSGSAAASSGCCTWTSCKERLEREFDLELDRHGTQRRVPRLQGGRTTVVHNPAEMPRAGSTSASRSRSCSRR